MSPVVKSGAARPTSVTRDAAIPCPRPRAVVAAVRPYDTGPESDAADLFLDENEAPSVLPGTQEALGTLCASSVRCYPEVKVLRGLLAERHAVEPERVFVSAGADESLDRFCRAFLEPGREAVFATPTFDMLPRYASLAGAGVVSVPWPRGEFPTDGVLGAVTERTGLIAVVSPNNPTGAAARARDLERVAAGAGSALVVADLAYAEFADEDLTETALRLPNVAITRSLSKAWGLAGLRVGYTIASRAVVQAMRVAGGPYSVSGPSLALAAATLRAGEGPMRSYVARVRIERQALWRLLVQLGADALPSQANFVTAYFRDAKAVQASLRTMGIAVHGYAPGHAMERALRITCPASEAGYARLEAALRAQSL